jgi:hypothetical protein
MSYSDASYTETLVTTLYLYYQPVTPYTVSSKEKFAGDNPQYKYLRYGVTPLYLFDLNLLELVVDTDPTIDATQHGSITISYTRFTGQGATYTVPVIVEIRSCPAYMK